MRGVVHDFWRWFGDLPEGGPAFVGTLTGSALGVLALIVGALFNAHLNRRRDDRLRQHECAAVRSTLIAELSAIKVAIQRNIKELKDNTPDGCAILLPTPSLAGGMFEAVKGKIGLIQDVEAITAVVDAYTVLAQFESHAITLGGRPYNKFPDSSIRHIHADGHLAPRFVPMYESLSRHINKALKALA